MLSANFEDEVGRSLLLLITTIFVGAFTAVYVVYIAITIRDVIPYFQAQHTIAKAGQDLNTILNFMAHQREYLKDLNSIHPQLAKAGEDLDNAQILAFALVLITIFHLLTFVYLVIVLITTFLETPNESTVGLWEKVKIWKWVILMAALGVGGLTTYVAFSLDGEFDGPSLSPLAVFMMVESALVVLGYGLMYLFGDLITRRLEIWRAAPKRDVQAECC